MTEWKKLKYDGELPEGIYWFVLESEEFDCDVADDGTPIKAPTGNLQTRIVLAALDWTHQYKHIFDAELTMCDPEERPLSDEEWIKCYAEVVKPEAPK